MNNIPDLTSSSSNKLNKNIQETNLPKIVAGLLVVAGSLGLIGALAVVAELATGGAISSFFAIAPPLAVVNPVFAAVIGGGALLLLIVGVVVFLVSRGNNIEEKAKTLDPEETLSPIVSQAMDSNEVITPVIPQVVDSNEWTYGNIENLVQKLNWGKNIENEEITLDSDEMISLVTPQVVNSNEAISSIIPQVVEPEEWTYGNIKNLVRKLGSGTFKPGDLPQSGILDIEKNEAKVYFLKGDRYVAPSNDTSKISLNSYKQNAVYGALIKVETQSWIISDAHSAYNELSDGIEFFERGQSFQDVNGVNWGLVDFSNEQPLHQVIERFSLIADMFDISITELNGKVSGSVLESLLSQDEMPDPIYRFADGSLTVFLLNQDGERAFVCCDPSNRRYLSQNLKKQPSLSKILSGESSHGCTLVPHKLSDKEVERMIKLLDIYRLKKSDILLDREPFMLKNGENATILQVTIPNETVLISREVQGVQEIQEFRDFEYCAFVRNDQGGYERHIVYNAINLSSDQVQAIFHKIQNGERFIDDDGIEWTIASNI